MNVVALVVLCASTSSAYGWGFPIDFSPFNIFGNKDLINCGGCNTKVADHRDVIVVSTNGSRVKYTNPHGYKHDTLTIRKMTNYAPDGEAVTEASWFPGYSWTIVKCKSCQRHLGWEYNAVEKRTLSKFYALTLKSVKESRAASIFDWLFF